MKTLKIASLIIAGILMQNSCQEDGEQITVNGLQASDLMASESSVILTSDNSASTVLALTWNESSLTISNGSMGIPSNVPVYTIEVSASQQFTAMTQIPTTANPYSFSGATLNTLAKNLGFAGGVSTPMYFRLNTAYGSNTEPFYSTVISVNVTCFTIDMSKGFILNASKEDTGFALYSPNSDGEYHGFTGATAWFNWFLLEGDGTQWGNVNVDGHPFEISSDVAAQWNFWYPGQSGCYYATLSTTNKEWTATWIPSLSVSGDVTTEMTFDRNAVKWYVSLTTTTANAKIKVSSANAALYNKTTGTDDASAIAKTLGFIANSDSTLSIDWNSASATDITIPTAGDYTLTFYLADATAWKYSLSSGSVIVPEKITSKLYLPGIDDGISGSWTFDNYLALISEDDSTFGGTMIVNSLWGYQMAIEKDNWTDVYQLGATEGTLAFKSGTNIPAPDAGLYLIQADLKNLTYSHTQVTGLSYAGFNDNWDLVSMDATDVPGAFGKSVTISAASEWGFQLLVNGDWALNYGGSAGALKFKGANLTDDATLAAGTYDLVANIHDTSYVFLGDKVYIGGLNDVWDFTTVVLNKSSMGIYTGTATINQASSWGIKIYVQQDNWDRFYGGSFSRMTYVGANITDDQTLAPGTYNVTVDFLNNTCSFVAQ